VIAAHTTSVPIERGAYTLPDAARLLRLPPGRVRAWVLGAGGDGALAHRGTGPDRTIGFHSLIELFSISELRGRGISWATLRAARQELVERFATTHPFALRGFLTDGKRLLRELGDQALLELGTGGQTAFERVIGPFCKRLDFDASTQLASRFYPAESGRDIVIDPHHAFGRPVVQGTNVTTEALACLIRGGERIEDVALDFRLEPGQVETAWRFEERLAACGSISTR
jgi:uncharacterized protein (DUF433 family)